MLRSGFLMAFERFADKASVNNELIYKTLAFTPNQIRGDGAMLPYEAVAELLHLSALKSGLADLGLRYAATLEPGEAGLVDHLAAVGP
jgi:hypothetical protein